MWLQRVVHAVTAVYFLALASPSNDEPSLPIIPPRWICLDCERPPPLDMVKQTYADEVRHSLRQRGLVRQCWDTWTGHVGRRPQALLQMQRQPQRVG